MRILSGRVLGVFGRYSYGLYVIHYLAKPLCDRIFSVDAMASKVGLATGTLVHVVLSIGLSVALAALSWHLFEVHVLKLKALFPTATKTAKA